MNPSIWVWRPGFVVLNKNKITCLLINVMVQADQTVNSKENERINKYLDCIRELKKTVERDGHYEANHRWTSWNIFQETGKETGGTGDLEMDCDHPDLYSVAIG